MTHIISFDKAEHAVDGFNRLYEMRMQKRHCDFVIKVGSERIPAHRSVLTAMSDYFDRMLSHDTVENSSGVVDMKNVDPDCVKICLDFMYGRESEVSDDNYEDLMHVANLMQLNKLAKIVEIIIGQNLNGKSFFAAWRIADMYECETLGSKCKEFAIENFQSISMQDEFGNLGKSFVTEIIESRSVKMTEEEKLKAALGWMKHDQDARSDDLVHFLKRVDLKSIPIEKRQQLMNNDPLIKHNLTCVRILSSSMVQSLQIQVEGMKEKAIVVFDKDSGHPQQFKPRSNSWRQMHRMNDVMKKKYFSALVYGGYIYVFMQNKEVFRIKYTDEAATWEQMAEMIEDHGYSPPVVVVGGLFYAIGGHGNCVTKCVDRFDPQTSKWTKLQDKLQATKFSTLLVMRGYIYSFGGVQEGVELVNNVQRFDPITSKWMEMKPMREAKGYVAAVELDDKAYVMGGYIGNHSASVDCYDPDLDQWTTLASMLIPRSWFRAFAIDGFIYAVGGCNSADSIEKYDFEKNEWKMVLMPDGMKLNILESVETKLDGNWSELTTELSSK